MFSPLLSRSRFFLLVIVTSKHYAKQKNIGQCNFSSSQNYRLNCNFTLLGNGHFNWNIAEKDSGKSKSTAISTWMGQEWIAFSYYLQGKTSIKRSKKFVLFPNFSPWEIRSLKLAAPGKHACRASISSNTRPQGSWPQTLFHPRLIVIFVPRPADFVPDAEGSLEDIHHCPTCQ